jgi:hypothetical protein
MSKWVREVGHPAPFVRLDVSTQHRPAESVATYLYKSLAKWSSIRRR